MAMSLEIRYLAASIERGANAVGMSIPPPATTESGDRERSSRSQPYKAHFCIKKNPDGVLDKSCKIKIQTLKEKSIASRNKGNPHLFLSPSFSVTLSQKSEVEAFLMLFL